MKNKSRKINSPSEKHNVISLHTNEPKLSCKLQGRKKFHVYVNMTHRDGWSVV